MLTPDQRKKATENNRRYRERLRADERTDRTIRFCRDNFGPVCQFRSQLDPAYFPIYSEVSGYMDRHTKHIRQR